MKSSLSAVRSVGGRGAGVVHEVVVVVVGLLRGAPPVGHAVRHGRRALGVLRPVAGEAELVVHVLLVLVMRVVRRVRVRGRGRALVGLGLVRGEVLVVEALELVGDGGVVRGVVRRRGGGAGGAGGHAHAAGGRGVVAVAVVARRRVAGRAVHLHVLAQRRRVRVRLVAARHAAVVRLVGRVHVRVLLPVGGVGEAPVAARVLALERLLA